MHPRLRSLAAGLCALLLLGAATPPPADASDDPATLLAHAQAARERGEPAQAQAQLERIVDEYDGTVEAVVAALRLLDLLVERWTRDPAAPEETIAAHDELTRRARALLRSRSYRRPEAARLREQAYYFATMAASPGWKSSGWGSERRDQYRRCGEEYMAILGDLEPDDVHVPDALVSAGGCFVHAGRVSEGEPLLRRVVGEHPRHGAGRLALRLLAEANLAVARFEDAADYAEQYARQEPRSRTAAELLEVAYTIRRGLGDDAQAEADLRAHEVAATPARKARFSRVRGEFLRDDGERIAYLARHLARHGAALELRERLADELTLAQFQWRRSCAADPFEGMCTRLARWPSAAFFIVPVDTRRREPVRSHRPPDVRSTRPYQPPPQCSAWPLGVRLVDDARDPALARAAQRRFQAVNAAARRKLAEPSLAPEERDAFAELAASSAIGLADRRFEQWLAIELAGTYEAIAEAAPAGPTKTRRRSRTIGRRGPRRAGRGRPIASPVRCGSRSTSRSTAARGRRCARRRSTRITANCCADPVLSGVSAVMSVRTCSSRRPAGRGGHGHSTPSLGWACRTACRVASISALASSTGRP